MKTKSVLRAQLLLLLAISQDISGLAQAPYANSHYMGIDGLRIHYQHELPQQSARKGRVLLLHGFACSSYSWRKILPTLSAAGYEVLAVDMPPFGYSSRPRRHNLSFSAQADLLWRLLDSLSGGSGEGWHLIGHSMGAATVGAMAAARPERTRSVVYVDGIVFDSGKGTLHHLRWLMRPKPITWAVSLAGQWIVISRKRVKHVLNRAYGYPAEKADVAAFLGPLRQRGTARGVIDMFAYAYPTFAYTTDSIRSPGLIIWGERDLIPLREARALQNKLLGVDLVTIPEAAHCPMETHSEAFNAILTGFLDQFSSNMPSESK